MATSGAVADGGAHPGVRPDSLAPVHREPYADGPLPGHTGGFGEPSCHRCHFGRPVGPPGGGLSVRGVPESFGPGSTYRIEVRVTSRELGRAGFQLSARCGSGARRGKQAGALAAPDERAEVVEGTGEEYRGTAGVDYAQHTAVGAEPRAGDAAAWTIRWHAPGGNADSASGAGSCGEVRVHVAANAANGDDSEFGDRIYVDSFSVSPGDP